MTHGHHRHEDGTLHADATNIVFGANEAEEVADDKLASYNVEGEPLVVLFHNGQRIKYWQGNGGPAPSHVVNDNGTLSIFMGDAVLSTHSQIAWLSVSGPRRQGRVGIIN